MELEDFFKDSKANTILSWSILALITVVLVESLLQLDILWILFSSLAVFLIILPPTLHRNKNVMLPWEVLVIAAIPIIVRSFEISSLANEIATYTAMAAVALIIAVELHIFTNVKFNHSFAILFTVVSTLALAGIWSIARFLMDIYLGTNFLTTNEALMQEYLQVLAAGIVAGILFDSYFRRRGRAFRKMIKTVIRR